MINYRIKKIAKFMGLFLMIALGMSFLYTTSTIQAQNKDLPEKNFTGSNGAITQTLFVDEEGIQIETNLYPRESVVHINITVLAQSNSSVNFVVGERSAAEFSPALSNHTLAPGESFADDYTFLFGTVNAIVYGCFCTTGPNATISWSYEPISVPNTGFIGIEPLFLVGAMILATVITRITMEKKRKN